MKRLIYLAPHSSADAQWDGWFSVAFAKGMRSVGIPTVPAHRFKAFALAGKVLRRAGLVRNLVSNSDRAYIVTVPHISEYKLFPSSYFNEIIPYAYDCWPYRYGEWERYFKRHDIQVAFFSARQSCEYFAARLNDTTCLWMPEACDADTYRSEKPLAARSEDVLEFGRRHEQYHSQIRPKLAERGYRHQFPAGGATRAELINLLADSKVSICFPRTKTSIGGAHAETLTLRYLEVMASRCLPVGYCPQELRDLFGYDPVIPADLDRPFEQLESILRSIDEYQSLVDRNYQSVLEVGTWERRAAQMCDALKSRGYEPALAAGTL